MARPHFAHAEEKCDVQGVQATLQQQNRRRPTHERADNEMLGGVDGNDDRSGRRNHGNSEKERVVTTVGTNITSINNVSKVAGGYYTSYPRGVGCLECEANMGSH